MISFKEFLIESVSVNDFLKSVSPSKIKFYSVRDNCGPAALDFLDYAKDPTLKRVSGYFRADKVVSEKADFTKEMKREFLKDGLDFNNADDRESWITKSKYSEEWKMIPHYWIKGPNGNIIDPSGQLQFINTGLAKDLNPKRYIET